MDFDTYFDLLKIAVLIMVIGLTLATITIIIFKEGLTEVSPKRAIVVRSIWLSTARALMKTGLIIPGVEKKLVEVTLENEPSDPPIMKALTKDGVEIGADLVIHTQRVVNDKDSVVKAATVIDYGKRTQAILQRIKIYVQDILVGCASNGNSIEGCTLESLIDGETKKEIIKRLEDYVNGKLLSEVKEEWGIEVIIGVRNLELPEKVKEVAEEAATAELEGTRIAEKAKAAGVDPTTVFIGDTIYDAVRALKGGKS